MDSKPGTYRELLEVTEGGVEDLRPGGEAGQYGGLICPQHSDRLSPREPAGGYSARLPISLEIFTQDRDIDT